MKVCVIGLGEIGGGLLKEMAGFRIDEIVGVDIDEKKLEAFRKEGFNVSAKVPENFDVYVVAVLLTEQVIDVVAKNRIPEKALVVIESTITPGTARRILELKPKTKLVVFPHRFDPPTRDVHGYFNVSKDFVRVIGASDEKTMEEALAFYKRYLPTEFLHKTSVEIAELCKPLENAYRYVEIAFAEELKMLCDKKGIDFNELRNAANTKWNIEIREARDGIGKHCLPKDIRIMDSFFGNNSFFKSAAKADEEYRKHLEKGRKD